MLQCRWLGVVVVAGVLSGCANKQPTTAPSASAQPVGTVMTLETARDQLTRANPNTQVGSVIATLPEANLAAVGEIPVAGFRVGDSITFLDANLNSLTLGTVIVIKNGNLQVRYDAPQPGHRLPQVGDIAVHIFNGVPPAPQSTASGDAAPVAVPATEPAPPAAPAPQAAPAPSDAAPTPAPAPSAPPAPSTAPSAPQPEMNK